MKRLCVVVATDATIKAFLLDQLRALSRRHALTVVANTCDAGLLAANGIEGELVNIGIERRISLGSDLRALLSLTRLFRGRKFDAVHSVTPKAGLLAMIAGKLARVPLRTHTFTGQVWATRAGPMRWLLKGMDRILASAATRVLADSESQRQFLIEEGVVTADRIGVLGAGSISGVDVARFRPDDEARAAVRAELQIPVDASVFLFIGRLNRDKGVGDLASAFSEVAAKYPSVYLVVAGPDEEGCLPALHAAVAAVEARARFVGFTRTPERLMAAADVFVLPSYREGFGSAIIEAAAVGVPAVASRIYGLTDAVVDRETGLLHAPGNVEELAGAMVRLANDTALRQSMGAKALARARRDFACERLTEAVVRYYAERLEKAPPS